MKTKTPLSPIRPLCPHRHCEARSNLLTQLFSYSIILLLFFSLNSCSGDSDFPRPATIMVTISGECVCNVFIYTPEGLCLQSKIYDCSETTRLFFNVYHEGELLVKAEYRDKVITKPITTTPNKTTEVDMIF